jgi:thiol-disulfide isomerase/thioredoxin
LIRLLATIFTLLLPLAARAGEGSLDALWATTLADHDDKPVALQKFRGRPLIVNFWARWCGPCRQEIPDFVQEYARHQGKVELLGIAIEDKAEPVRDFAKAYEINYPIMLAKDQGLPLMQALDNSRAGLPFTLVIDRRGQVVQRKLGPMNKAEIAAAFAAALK